MFDFIIVEDNSFFNNKFFDIIESFIIEKKLNADIMIITMN